MMRWARTTARSELAHATSPQLFARAPRSSDPLRLGFIMGPAAAGQWWTAPMRKWGGTECAGWWRRACPRASLPMSGTRRRWLSWGTLPSSRLRGDCGAQRGAYSHRSCRPISVRPSWADVNLLRQAVFAHPGPDRAKADIEIGRLARRTPRLGRLFEEVWRHFAACVMFHSAVVAASRPWVRAPVDRSSYVGAARQVVRSYARAPRISSGRMCYARRLAKKGALCSFPVCVRPMPHSPWESYSNIVCADSGAPRLNRVGPPYASTKLERGSLITAKVGKCVWTRVTGGEYI